jgi:serine/threonine protein phosphatase PrpC
MKVGIMKVDGRGRPSEDRSFSQELPGGIHIAGVLDGHSGLATVIFLTKDLPVAIAEFLQRTNPNDETNVRSGIRSIFIEQDKKLARQGALSYRDSGSTCTIAIITPKKIYLAYVGDSPACVFNTATGELYGKIGKHEPSDSKERERIERNGGEVTIEPGDAPRVNGCLMVSRAFGDFSMKFKHGNKPTNHEMTEANWSNDFCVVADPDIIVVPRPENGGIIAIFSDGFVETPDGKSYKSYEENVQVIIEEYNNTGGVLEKCAIACVERQVASFTKDQGNYTGDDITLVLIELDSTRVSVPVISGGSTGQTRKGRVGHRRTRSNKKRIARSFYI